MNKFYTALFFLIVLQINVFASKENKNNLIKNIEKNISTYNDIALKIWDYAEVGYKEEKSSKELIQILKNNGFKITEGVAGIPTAFIAEYGVGGPVVGILGEYDALPGLSQSNNPKKERRSGVNSGHGCGHNLFGVASAAAAIATKEWLMASKTKGTIRFYGCPAEEGGSGKVYMVREGLFDDVDVALHWHPSSKNRASAGSTLANKTGKIRFYGTSAHAAGAPERGRSALDGLEAMNNMLNMMREHVEEKSRIHYIITKGGDAPNVVPNFAEGYYYVRNPNPEEVRKMWKRVELCAEGASIGTETTFSVEVTGGVYNILPNESLQKLVHKNLSEVGGVYYNEEEKSYAEKLSITFGEQKQDILLARTVEPYEFRASTSGGGSTDVGDVSWVVPTVGFSTATYVPGTPGHSWQAASCTGTSIGLKGMLNAAKTLALTSYDLFNNTNNIKEAKKEFNEKKGVNYNYNPLIGDRKPALDYRN